MGMVDLSPITSVLAIAMSSLTLGWTIYRDAIRKPKMRVRVAVKTIIQKDRPNDGPHIFVEGLNMGPIPNRIGLVFVRGPWWYRFTKHADKRAAFIYPNFGHWATTKAGTKLEVGDEAQFIFPYDRECFLKEPFHWVGLTDGYGRMHWCKRKDVRVARKRYEKDFPRQAT